MPRNQKEQAKSTLARAMASTKTNADAETKDLQEEYAEEFRAIVANATAAYERYHAPPTRPGSRQYPEADQWPKDSKALFGKFAQELCDIRRNFSWVRQNAKQAFLVFAGLCEGWITVISQLESDRTGESAEGLRSKYRRGIARAIRLALANATRRIRKRGITSVGKRKSDALDVFQRTMKRNPALPFREICGRIDDEYDSRKRPIPLPPKCLRHGHTTLVQSIDCTFCRRLMKSLLSMKRAPLDLPRPPRSKFPLAGETTKLNKVKS